MAKVQEDPIVLCPYCGAFAVLVDGKVIYPHRPDLKYLKFWQCAPCGAYVGCHKRGVGYGNGTVPLGRLANAELRMEKSRAHRSFDPLWETGMMSRTVAYAWLAVQMGIPRAQCHIGMFDVDQCKQVVHLANTYLRTRMHSSAKE